MYTRNQIRYEMMSGANVFSRDIQSFVNGILDDIARTGGTVVPPVQITPVQGNRINPLTAKPEVISVIVIQVDYTEQVSDLEGIPDDDDAESDGGTVTGVTGVGQSASRMLRLLDHGEEIESERTIRHMDT